MLKEPMPMPMMSTIPMTVVLVTTGRRLLRKAPKVTRDSLTAAHFCSELELGGEGGLSSVTEAQASTNPTKLGAGTKIYH